MGKARIELDGKDGLESWHMHSSGVLRPGILRPGTRAAEDTRRLLALAALKPAGLSEWARAEWSRWFLEFILDREPDTELLLGPRALRVLQQRVATLLTTYLAGKPVKYDAFPRRGTLSRKADGTPIMTVGASGSSLNWFTWHAIQAIAAVGQRIKLCADRTCGKPFVATRGQRYCTRRCSDRVRLARFRRSHAQDEAWQKRVRAQRRAAYAKRVKSKLGQNVRVQTKVKEG